MNKMKFLRLHFKYLIKRNTQKGKNHFTHQSARIAQNIYAKFKYNQPHFNPGKNAYFS